MKQPLCRDLVGLVWSCFAFRIQLTFFMVPYLRKTSEPFIVVLAEKHAMPSFANRDQQIQRRISTRVLHKFFCSSSSYFEWLRIEKE